MASPEVKRIHLQTFVGLVSVAFVISLILTAETVGIRSGQPHGAFCPPPTDVFDCGAVAMSTYSQFMGLPVALWASWFCLGLLGLVLPFPALTPFRIKAVVGVSGFLTVGSLVFLLISHFKIGRLCPLCLLWDFAIVTVFVFAVWLSQKTIPPPKVKASPVFTILLVAVGLVVSIPSFKRISKAPVKHQEAQRVEPEAPPTNDTDARLWSGDGSLNVIVFSDFQCPYCALAAKAMDEWALRYPGRITVFFKHFPLDMQCNRMITRPGHMEACWRARISQCAWMQGQFKNVHDALFADQEGRVDSTVLKEWARKFNLDEASWLKCIESKEMDALVKAQIEEGIQSKIQGTPTIFFNGKAFMERPTPEAFDEFARSVGVNLR